ncbi:MAG: polyketide biosynthesis acyl carrier protein [Acidobacteriota bacterium]|nr:polyketide biosynthesis acyl carrier protein [Acidobacteriota bacterium]
MTQLDVFQTVKRVTLEVLPFLPPEEVSIEKSLKDLGANSIDRMEVVTRSMESLGIKVPLVEFGKVKNLEGLVDVLQRFAN